MGGAMTKHISFSHLEHKFMHVMRERINHSENQIDLKNQFSYTINDFLRSAFQDKNVTITFDDICFDVDTKHHYKLKKDLKKSPVFMETWKNSDISCTIERFACMCYKRYVHICKHNEKTEKKIRN